MIRTTWFRRAVFTAALLSVMILGVASLLAPTSVLAAAGNCTYYSSGSYTTVVGKFGKDCCNNPVAWGVKTSFSRCGGCFVCFPPNP